VRDIFIIHPGKANYPEVSAYKDFFSGSCTVLDGTLSDFMSLEGRQDWVAWCIMGFYPAKIDASVVIHDYRSLSVGAFVAAKDYIKKKFQPKPDLRIFQNEAMSSVMSFSDDVETLYLPMGVPSFIYNIEATNNPLHKQKFCYIGEMSRERNFDKVLDAFVNNDQGGSIVLVGSPQKEIYEKYRHFPQLIFTGRVSQKEALSIVKACAFSVCYFPWHRPHKFQAPTKLLEYMALGVSVICNDAPSNLRELEKFSYPATVSGDYVFGNNLSFDLTPPSAVKGISWRDVIGGSGIYDALSVRG